MEEFVLIFRMDITTPEAQPSPALMQEYLQSWQSWIQGIESSGKLAEGGNHLSREGRVIRQDNAMTDSPYTADKESIAGYIIVHAKDLDEATGLAQNCPILHGGSSSVEVRKVAGM